MQRVMKSEVAVEKFIQPDGLEYCIACWKDYMLNDDRDLSASRMQLRGEVTIEEAAGYEYDHYDDQRKADMRIGEATAAIVEDLPLQLAWAIKKMAGIARVWNFPSLDYAETLITAKTQLEIKLRKNIVTAIKF